MARTSTLLVLVSLLMLSGGCVSQGERDALLTRNRQAEQQIVDLQSSLEEAETRIRVLEASTRPADPATVKYISELEAQNAQMRETLKVAEETIRNNSGAIVMGGPLPEDLDAALRALAQQHPDIMTYDSSRGMIKMKSDLTFALGSTEVKSGGVEAIQMLAGVVNSPAAAKYGVRVVGHTDNVPVSNATNKRRFGDNWGLSAFRAIAVKDVLSSAGVHPARIEIAGRGEFQPIVQNGPRGAEANRRVEIFLVRLPGSSIAGPGVATDAAAASDATPIGENNAEFK